MKRLGVAGIIRGDGFNLLLGRRGKNPNRGLYVLPGGGVKDGESLEEAFCREVMEETGLKILPTIGYSRWQNPYVIELPDRLILVAKAQITGENYKTPISGSDLYDAAWFDYLFLPHDISPVVTPVLAMHGFYPRKKID